MALELLKKIYDGVAGFFLAFGKWLPIFERWAYTFFYPYEAYEKYKDNATWKDVVLNFGVVFGLLFSFQLVNGLLTLSFSLEFFIGSVLLAIIFLVIFIISTLLFLFWLYFLPKPLGARKNEKSALETAYFVSNMQAFLNIIGILLGLLTIGMTAIGMLVPFILLLMFPMVVLLSIISLAFFLAGLICIYRIVRAVNSLSRRRALAVVIGSIIANVIVLLLLLVGIYFFSTRMF